MKINPDKWTDWRKEEKEKSKEILKKLKTLSPLKLRDSYFLRDVVVAYLDNKSEFNDKDISFISTRLKALIGKDVSKQVRESFKIWGVDNGVDVYLTPKSLLYTIRGDYPF